jgi:hypothetical protein
MSAEAADGMRISVLPHAQFPRLVDDLTGVVVAHPLSGKTLDETRTALAKLGLWVWSSSDRGQSPSAK